MQESIAPRDWLVALSQVPGVGRKSLWRLIPCLDSPSMTIKEFRRSLQDNLSISPQIKDKLKSFDLEDILRTKTSLHHKHIQTITMLDPAFPLSLKEIPDPPLVLYAVGDLQLLEYPILSVVGTRTPTSYGRHVAFHMAQGLGNAGICIASGLARGIDGEAHKGALQTPSGTIAVLGCGIDVVYPSQHQRLYEEIRKKGLILSEYPPGTPVSKGLFPERNRLISGLSLGVIVVEAALRSGSSITVQCALEQGRDVFAVPGSILSPQSLGPLRLIKEGAKMVTKLSDILEEYTHLAGLYKGSFHLEEEEALTEKEKKLLDMIENTQVSADQICAASSMPVREVLGLLLSLEIRGWVKQLPGSIFVRVK